MQAGNFNRTVRRLGVQLKQSLPFFLVLDLPPLKKNSDTRRDDVSRHFSHVTFGSFFLLSRRLN